REELLANPDVHAVYVATEHHRHCEDVLACAAAGKQVLCEKPMANSVADCRRMIEACAAHGVALQVAYYRRYYPKLVQMREMLHAGAIGEPVTASIHLAHRLARDKIGPANWRLNAEVSGGGQLVDTGSHRLDLLCWLLGEPDRVAALAECQEMPIEATDIESLLIRMQSGVHAVTRHGYRSNSPDELSVTGTEGTLDATPVDGPFLRLRGRGREEVIELPKHENVHFPLFDDFTRRVRVGEPVQHPGEAGMQASRIIEAAYESARSGRIVSA
ncbi:MAG: Gfo/Idh/MocA family oxidoreductase, partial [Armatimonadetes bacterium]|nr:Gfo/Idh/MocA family oxidoreductase [Armatimonadota bacterium]